RSAAGCPDAYGRAAANPVQPESGPQSRHRGVVPRAQRRLLEWSGSTYPSAIITGVTMTGATSLSPLQRIALTLLSGLLLAALAAGGTYLLYHWQQSGYPLWAPSVSQPTAVVAPGCAQRIDRHFGDRLVS